MVKTFVGNGIESASQMSIVVNGMEMPLDNAEIILLGMEMPARCSAVTMHDAKKLQTQKGWMLIDAVGSTLSFVGTVAEWQGRQQPRANPPWPTRQLQSRYVEDSH